MSKHLYPDNKVTHRSRLEQSNMRDSTVFNSIRGEALN